MERMDDQVLSMRSKIHKKLCTVLYIYIYVYLIQADEGCQPLLRDKASIVQEGMGFIAQFLPGYNN